MKQKKNESTEKETRIIISFDSCAKRDMTMTPSAVDRNICAHSGFFSSVSEICVDAIAKTHLLTGLDNASGVATPSALIRCCIVGVADVIRCVPPTDWDCCAVCCGPPTPLPPPPPTIWSGESVSAL